MDVAKDVANSKHGTGHNGTVVDFVTVSASPANRSFGGGGRQ